MSLITAMCVEGVLRRRVGGAPIPAGSALYHGLKTAMPLILLTQERDLAEVEHFLLVERLTGHTQLIGATAAGPDMPQLHLTQLNRLRSTGVAICMFITDDLDAATLAIRGGIAALTYCAPSFALPRHMPDYKEPVPTWQRLAQEVADQRRKKADDLRLTALEGVD